MKIDTSQSLILDRLNSDPTKMLKESGYRAKAIKIGS